MRRIDELLEGADQTSGRRGIASAAGLSILARSAQISVQVATVILLARFLSPEDFGLFGMVTPIIAFFLVFRDAGLSMATLQSRNLSETQSSTLFFLNLMVGAGLAGALAALSWPLSWLYGDERLQPFAAAFAGLFLLSATRAQQEALLFRSYRFGRILRFELIASGTALVLSVIAAAHGWSYWSLLVRQACYEACYAALLVGYLRWIPRHFSLDAKTIGMVRFGANVAISDFVTYFLRNIDNVLIGWWCGAGPLGLYALAYRTVLFPIQQFSTPLARVMIPHLSGVRDDALKFTASYLAGLRLLVILVGIPLAVFWSFAEEAIVFLLGDRWLGIVEIAHWLIPAGFAQVIMIAAGWAGLSLERSQKNLQWSMISLPVVLAGFVIGLRFGPVGVAAGYAMASWLLLLPCFIHFLKGTVIRLRDAAWAILPCAVSAGVIALALERGKDVAIAFNGTGYLNPGLAAGVAIAILAAAAYLAYSAAVTVRSFRRVFHARP